MKISSDEAFLILHKWQVKGTPVVLVGSLMPNYPLRGLVAVVTREGIWDSCEKPASIWGFSLRGEGTNFLASQFESFEHLQFAELPSDIKMSLSAFAGAVAVLALTKTMTLMNAASPKEGNRRSSVEETMFLAEELLH